jgi:hypothetical protein
MVDRRGLQKKRSKMVKRKQRDKRKESRQKGGYKNNAKERAISRLRTGYTRATHGPKKGLATQYAPSTTSIYPSTTYCGNAKKLTTRERT